MKPKLVFLIVSLFALSLTARAAEDQSTPKGTLKAFARATREADQQKLRSCLHAADGSEARMAEAMVDATFALARLRLDAIEKYGGVKARVLSGGVPTEQEVEQFDAAVEKIDGNKATVILKAGPRAGSEMQLVRIDGLWKIAVSQSTGGKTPEQVETEIATLRNTARIVDQTREEIAAGRYKMAREAADALGAKMQKLAKPAASQPAATK